ncbi:MAG TPA: preprotein translocase subunit YajC [Gaiellaceae bacterium]|nr:preprotein translocase subunit YajC [Gaiellaceae bacterium]
MSTLVLVVILFLLFWLLLIRPQRRRQAALNQVIANVEVGDEIVTAGGLYGHVVGVGEDELLVEIAPGTNVRIARRAVAGVVGPDEEEDEEETEEQGEEETRGELEEPAAAEEEPAPGETPR